ncbi:MAG: DUF7660 family protein [Chloroflexota bacterium]
MKTVATDLNEQVKAIDSREDFVSFVRALARSFDQEPDGWENRDLGAFLEAAAAWTEDMDGYFRNRGEPVPRTPSWRVLGEILTAARVYE